MFELCDSCYARIVNIHSTENTQDDPDPPVSPSLLEVTPLLDDISNMNDTENNPPSASGSGNRASARLVEITKTARNKYQYKFTYKDVTQIPTATITPNMADDIEEDPDNENISDDENKKNSTTNTNTSDSDSDTPIIDFSISNDEDPRVTDVDEEHDSNGEEIVEGMQ